jgi:uncharacterized protein (UPF0210 family)
MKVRTITTGISLKYPIDFGLIKKTADFNSRAKKAFEAEGYEVQTLRICSQPWTEYLGKLGRERVVSTVQEIEKVCLSNGMDFFNIGTVPCNKKANLDFIGIVPDILKATTKVSASVSIADSTAIDFEAATRAASAIKRISEITDKGYRNFGFAAIANCPAGVAFFPAAYHDGGKPSFSVGLECGDLLVKAFEGTTNLIDAKQNLAKVLQEEFGRIQKVSEKIEKKEKIGFRGIDASIAPSLDENGSIAYAFERLEFGKFGTPGTLAIASLVTGVVKSLKLKRCGYSGLMLPVLEDVGLARRSDERLFNLPNLLLYSSVCGTGFDTVPLPGDVSVKTLELILLDVASQAVKLNKPLSARLFPVPLKKAGERTDFDSPYLANCRVMEI